jgi:hypothetical protein
MIPEFSGYLPNFATHQNIYLISKQISGGHNELYKYNT